MKKQNWQEAAELIESLTEEVDYEERYFTCPECGEPIYESDYPIIHFGHGTMKCPVCEEEISYD